MREILRKYQIIIVLWEAINFGKICCFSVTTYYNSAEAEILHDKYFFLDLIGITEPLINVLHVPFAGLAIPGHRIHRAVTSQLAESRLICF